MATITLVNELPIEEKSNKSCVFCNKDEDNELLFGKFFTNGSLTAHYNCLLFASGLDQKGKVDEGILGFLIKDIEKEVKRGSKLNCFECKKKGATVGCCNEKCRRTFHFPCGSQTKMLNQYMGAFESFCINHHPVQKVPAEPFVSDQKTACTICHEAVKAKASYDVLWAPCCMKQAWFHRDCTQKMALSAGSYFRCPMCSNKGIFVKEMKKMGIYVPNQDSSWELEPNAFYELCERHNSCDHPTCVCPEGRTHDDPEVGMPWDLILCHSCGSKGLHLQCGKLEPDINEWDCEDCSKIPGQSLSQIRQKQSNDDLESSSSSGTSSCSTPTNRSPTALKRRHPVEEGSFSDDDSDIEIIAIVSASSSSAQPFRYYSNPPFTAINDAHCSQRGKVHVREKSSVHSSCLPTSCTLETVSCSTGSFAAAAKISLTSHANQDSLVGESDQSHHSDIKIEKDEVTSNPDLALKNHEQESKASANNERDDDGFQQEQVVEVGKLTYREFTIKIYTDAASDKKKSSPRFFFEPIVVLDPNSIIIQSQEFFQQYVVRFSILMWNAEIRSQVLELVRHDQPESKEMDVSIMPYEDVQLVGKPGSIHHSIKIMEEATSYHRLNEKLDFFLVCDSSSTAKVLADNLRRYPEFVVRKWQLALECRGLSLNSSVTDGKASPMKRPFFKIDVSTFPIDYQVPKEIQSGGCNRLLNISPPPYSGGAMSGPAPSSQHQPIISGGSSTASSATPVIQRSEQHQEESNNRGRQKTFRNGSSASQTATELVYSQTIGAGNRDSTPPTMYMPHLQTSLPPNPSAPGSVPFAGLTPQQLELIWKNPNNFASHHPAAMAMPHEALFLAHERRERERDRICRETEVKEQQQREREQHKRMEKQQAAPTQFERETQALRQAVQQHYQESLPRNLQQIEEKKPTPSSPSSSQQTFLMPVRQQQSKNGQHVPSIRTLSGSNPGANATAVPVFSVVECMNAASLTRNLSPSFGSLELKSKQSTGISFSNWESSPSRNFGSSSSISPDLPH